MPPDPLDLKLYRVMVVDGNPLSRSELVAQLRELGAEQLSEHAHPEDARRDLAFASIDLVLCAQCFDGSSSTGQDLLDELRQTHPLAFELSFIMVTGPLTTAKVPAAGDSWVDGYLVRPFTTNGLLSCIQRARQRKWAVQPAFDALRLGQIDLATKRFATHCTAGGESFVYAGQVAVELLLRQGVPEAAQALLLSLKSRCSSSWLTLGLARCHVALGENKSALARLQGLTKQDSGYAEAFDLESQVRQAQAQLPEALAAACRARQLTPGSATRQQRVGILAFCNGDDELARSALDRSIALHLASPLFDAQVLLLRALLMYRTGDRRGLAKCLSQLLQLSRARLLEDARLQRLTLQVQTLVAAQGGEHARVAALLSELGAPMQRDDCTAESACHLTALLSELASRQAELLGVDTLLLRIGLRFAVSQSAIKQLQAFAAPHPPHVDLLKQSQAQLQSSLDAARGCVEQGDPAQGVALMVSAAESSLNARLLDNARLMLTRYRAEVPEHHHLQARIEQLAVRLLPPLQCPPTAAANGRSVASLGAIKRPSSAATPYAAVPC